MSKLVYGIEGIDRLGKSTLIRGIRNKLGYYEVVHFQKPEKLEIYTHSKDWQSPEYIYQSESFRNSMLLARSGARIIFDRWHLGEAVYSNIYRGYDGNYVFDIEQRMDMDQAHSTRLILLIEDFNVSRHFVDDGDSFDINKRVQEQDLFVRAFDKSMIKDKRIICVTDQGLGGFRLASDILQEALE